MKKKSLIALLLMSFMLVGCSTQGPIGETGPQGPTGETGPQGPTGSDGQDGKDGTSMLTGEGAPSADLGKDGDSYIDTNTWDFYVKVNGTWVLKGNVKVDSTDHDGTEGLEFYPLSSTECGVAVGTAKYLKEIIIPETYKDYTVTTIIQGGFQNTSVEKIYIPDSVTTISGYAFYCCFSLTSVTLGNGVTSIGEVAFNACSSLTSITIPDSVTIIGDSAFYGCSSLTIYCKATSRPSGWSSYWNISGRPVYWGGEWEYVGGVPTPINN